MSVRVGGKREFNNTSEAFFNAWLIFLSPGFLDRHVPSALTELIPDHLYIEGI